MNIKTKFAYLIFISCMFSSCTLTPIKCILIFSDYTKTYEFSFSKEELKNRIVESYSYDVSVFVKNLGVTIIENADINKEYRKSVDIWLDKSNWDNFKSVIRQNTNDTLNIIIGKWQSRKEIQLEVIIRGDNHKSSLTVHGFKYQQSNSCQKDKEYFLLTLSEKIDKKIINKLGK